MDFQDRFVFFARRPSILNPLVLLVLKCFLALLAALNVMLLSLAMRLMGSPKQEDCENLVMVSNLILVNSTAFTAVLITFFVAAFKARKYWIKTQGPIHIAGKGFRPNPLRPKNGKGPSNLQTVVIGKPKILKTPKDMKKADRDYIATFDSKVGSKRPESQKELKKSATDFTTPFKNMTAANSLQPMKYPAFKIQNHVITIDEYEIHPINLNTKTASPSK